MTIYVLIIDPDISFTVPVKRALEQSGDYAVSVFASAQAALDFSRREDQDVAILDFGVEDMSIPNAIQALRKIQPSIFILVSPRTHDHVAQLPTLDIQGSITKPYYARQVASVIKEAASARARLAERKRVETSTENASGESANSAQNLSAISASALYSAPGPLIEEPPIPDDATVGELVTGMVQVVETPLAAKEAVQEPEAEQEPQDQYIPPILPASIEPPLEPLLPDIPEPEDQPDLATLALESANDDTVPFDRVSIQALIEQVEKPSGFHIDLLPPWLRKNMENNDPQRIISPDIEPSFVASIPETLNESDTAASSSTRRVNAETASETPDDSELSSTWGELVDDASAESMIVPDQPDEPIQEAVQALPVETEPATNVQAESAIAEPEIIQEPAEYTTNKNAGNDPETRTTSEVVAEENAVEVADIAVLPVAESVETADTLTTSETREASSESEEIPDSVAKLAVQLTQLSVNLTAQATILSRGETLIASAGSFSGERLGPILATINSVSQNSDADTLLRFVHVMNEGDFLLFSTRTLDNMALSMLFAADTPIKVIRRQVQQLKAALENVPEGEAELGDEPEAARTLPSRPTGLRPPEGLRDALQPQTVATPPAPPVSFLPYSFVWLPRATQSLDQYVSVMVGWLSEIAAQHNWKIDGTEIQSNYIAVQISIPSNETPTAAVEALKHEVADRAGNPVLWAESYYLVPSGRPVTQQEIANYLEFQRDITS